MLRLLISCLEALLVGLVMTRVAKVLALRFGVVDKPGARRVHQGVVPRMGGLGIYCGFIAGSLVYIISHPNLALTGEALGLLISASIVFLTGLVDDVRSIRPTSKLAGQLMAALVFVSFGGYVKFFSNPFGGDILYLDYWGIPVTVLWLVGISNAVNLIDGLDGLAGGVSIISACTMGVVSLSHGYYMPAALLFVLAASTLGFLRYNFSPASIFMGDSGSLTLGYVLGAIAIMGFAKGATMIALVIPILILAIPIMDTFFAIIRRLLEHKPIMQPDKGHLHHRLLAKGLSHKQTVLIIYAITMFMGCIAILTALLNPLVTLALLVSALALLFFGAKKLGILGVNMQMEPAAAETEPDGENLEKDGKVFDEKQPEKAPAAHDDKINNKTED